LSAHFKLKEIRDQQLEELSETAGESSSAAGLEQSNAKGKINLKMLFKSTTKRFQSARALILN
jgi:hypothetical protein